MRGRTQPGALLGKEGTPTQTEQEARVPYRGDNAPQSIAAAKSRGRFMVTAEFQLPRPLLSPPCSKASQTLVTKQPSDRWEGLALRAADPGQLQAKGASFWSTRWS